MYVMTVDQRHSRRDVDRVQELLDRYAGADLVRPFERTAGDEVQAVASNPRTVVTLTLELVRTEQWSVGIGVGLVEEPLPTSTRAGRGPAFEVARDAVTRAKNATGGLAVTGANSALSARATDAETALMLVAGLVLRRTPQGHEAVDLLNAGHTRADVAESLNISKQALSQRLSVAGWTMEAAGRTLALRLLAEADGLEPS